MVIAPFIAIVPPTPITATCPSVGSASSAGLSRAVIRAARIRSANSVRARPSRVATSRASWPKPLTTRTPVTVSSTCCATSAARCCADQVAGKSERRERTVTSPARGSTTRVTRVSSGESQSIAAIEVTISDAVPSVNGTIESSPCTSCRSVIARDATCPVRNASWRSPSSRVTASKTCRRRSCWTSRDIRPA